MKPASSFKSALSICKTFFVNLWDLWKFGTGDPLLWTAANSPRVAHEKTGKFSCMGPLKTRQRSACVAFTPHGCCNNATLRRVIWGRLIAMRYFGKIRIISFLVLTSQFRISLKTYVCVGKRGLSRELRRRRNAKTVSPSVDLPGHRWRHPIAPLSSSSIELVVVLAGAVIAQREAALALTDSHCRAGTVEFSNRADTVTEHACDDA